MIKQIQLRGISHRPSDRMTSDGGVEDCIDLRLEDQEHGPAVAPLDVTDTLAPGLSNSGISVLYIHKTNNYTNYVGTLAGSLVAWHKVAPTTWDGTTIKDLGGESIVSITSIGNMLVYSTDAGKTYYALYKDGAYKDFGSDLPRPTVKFSTTPVAQEKTSMSKYASESYSHAEAADPGVTVTAQKFWEYIMSLRPMANTGMYPEEDAFYSAVKESVWDEVDALRKNQHDNGNFTAPVLVRYALRMNDGSYVNVSEPILLTGAAQHLMVTEMNANIGEVNGGGPHYFLYEIMLANVFSASVSIQMENASDWADLISSVDVFVSTDIIVPALRTEFASEAQQTGETMRRSDMTFPGEDVSIGYDIDNEKEEFETRLLEKGNFYKIESFPLEELPSSGKQMKGRSQDDLVVLPRLDEAQAHTVSGIGNISSYNNRLVSGEQKVVLSPGHSEPQAIIPSSGSSLAISVVYRVRDPNGGSHTVRGYRNVALNDKAALAWISYPDPACYSATVYVSSGSTMVKHVLTMKEHPRLDCAYGFWGLNRKFDTSIHALDGWISSLWNGFIENENPTYTVGNRLALSAMDNPFMFPLGQRERFSSRILRVVPATISLSAFQSGPFPFYIFTEDGIWAESINAEGGLSNKLVVSRDVAVEGTITQLDKAVVFVSDQGVMLLSDMQVTCLSPFMQGPQYSIAEFVQAGSGLRAALESDGWGDLLDLHLDTTDFQDFVSGCRALYDYGGKRILFFVPSESYGYEYALDTQTWHRVSLPGTFTRTLNGYPDALAIFDGSIYDWSILPDYNAGGAARKGIILSRPFDLEAPDVRKSINSIRIRGRYDRQNVKYLLFGSFDGLRWQKLISLRGGSYKLFRIMILADLEPEERISWIDVDFETRFADKLR